MQPASHLEPNSFIDYRTMCDVAFGAHLTKGMNFRLRGERTVVLMATRDNAPYPDKVEEDGRTLHYVGHNQPHNTNNRSPELVDQMLFTPTGGRTENGKFWDAAARYQRGDGAAERVLVFEKIRKGIWVFSGIFKLVSAQEQHDGTRTIFVFTMQMTDDSLVLDESVRVPVSPAHQRTIPPEVKRAVYARDRGQCVTCGATDNLHFDHILPFSKGGTSLTAENVQLLCARHNLQKHDRIE